MFTTMQEIFMNFVAILIIHETQLVQVVWNNIHSHRQTTNHIPAMLQKLNATTEQSLANHKPHSITLLLCHGMCIMINKGHNTNSMVYTT